MLTTLARVLASRTDDTDAPGDAAGKSRDGA